MKKKNKGVLFFLVGSFVLLLLGGIIFENNITVYTCYIAEVSNGKSGSSILTLDDLDDYEKDNQGHAYQGIIFGLPWYISGENLEAGQKVKIYFNGDVRLSAPGRAELYWIRKLN